MKFNFTNSMIVAMSWNGLCLEHVVSLPEQEKHDKQHIADKHNKASGAAK